MWAKKPNLLNRSYRHFIIVTPPVIYVTIGAPRPAAIVAKFVAALARHMGTTLGAEHQIAAVAAPNAFSLAARYYHPTAAKALTCCVTKSNKMMKSYHVEKQKLTSKQYIIFGPS